MTSVKYIDRGYKDSIVLIPGWATDCRVFDTLDLEFNYLLPFDFSPESFEVSLLNELEKRNIKKVSLFGWSLGGFVACEFATRHASLIDRLILVGIRERYQKDGLNQIKKSLTKSKRGYLYKFYNTCFHKKDDASWFKKHLLKNYCKDLNLDYLFKTLDYLESARVLCDKLSSIKNIKIIHGECDNIAPFKEALTIRENLSNAEFIAIKDTGHMPFLNRGFTKYI